MTKCLKTLFLQIGQTTVYSAQRYLLSTTRWHTGRLAQQLLRYDKMFKNLIFANWTNNSVATCWAQRADTQVDWPNSFWDMTKCLKPYFCKLKKQQCIPRSATCWAQRIDTHVDWPNSFWDMTKCLKHYFCKLKKRQCIRRSATCWAQRVDTQVDCPNSCWDMTKCLKTLFLQIGQTTVYSAQRYLLSTTRWHSGRLAQ